MARRRKAHCALCGTLSKVTDEHFVPKCLWSDPRPVRTETVPTCESCNSGANHDDEYFRNTLVLMMGDHPQKKQLFASKVRRSLERQPDELRKLVETASRQPLFTQSGIFLGNHPTFTLDRRRFERNLRKIVKGLFYIIRKQPFPADGEIGIVGQLNEQTKPLIEFIEENFNPTFDFGDDVFEWTFFQTTWGLTAWKMAFYRNTVFYGLAFESQTAKRQKRHPE
jgi:hypothetical protein